MHYSRQENKVLKTKQQTKQTNKQTIVFIE